MKADKDQITHVLFIINLPQQVANSSFVGFKGNPWVSYHIDDLSPTGDNVVTARKLFMGKGKVVLHYNVLPETDAFITEVDQRVNLEDEEIMEITSRDVILQEDMDVSNDRRNDVDKVNVNTEVDQQVNLEDKGNMETTSGYIIEEGTYVHRFLMVKEIAQRGIGISH